MVGFLHTGPMHCWLPPIPTCAKPYSPAHCSSCAAAHGEVLQNELHQLQIRGRRREQSAARPLRPHKRL